MDMDIDLDISITDAFNELYASRVGLPTPMQKATSQSEYDLYREVVLFYQKFSSSVQKIVQLKAILNERFLCIISPNIIYTKLTMIMLNMILGNREQINDTNFDYLLQREGGRHRNLLKDFYREQHAQYPCIYINLDRENIKIEERLKIALYCAFSDHDYLLNNENMNKDDKDLFKKYRYKENHAELTVKDMENSLYFLSKLLCQHFKKKILVLIANYDSPILYALGRTNIKTEHTIKILKNLFSNTFSESNFYVNRAVVTGYCYISDVGISSIKSTDIYKFLGDRSLHGKPLNMYKVGPFRILRPLDERRITDLFYPTAEESQHWYDYVRYRRYTSRNFYSCLHVPFIFASQFLKIPSIRMKITELLHKETVEIMFVDGISTEDLISLERLKPNLNNCKVSLVHLYIQLLCHQGCFDYTRKSAEENIYCVSLPKDTRWDLYFNRLW